MNNNRAKMKTKQFKIATWFINKHLGHKVDIHYDNETKKFTRNKEIRKK